MFNKRPLARCSMGSVDVPHHIEQRQRNCEHDGAKHQSKDAENIQAAEHREEDEQLVQLGFLSDEFRPEKNYPLSQSLTRPRRPAERR